MAAERNNLTTTNVNAVNGNTPSVTDDTEHEEHILTANNSENELVNLASHPLFGFNHFLSAKNSMEFHQKNIKLGKPNHSLPAVFEPEDYAKLTSNKITSSKSVIYGSCLAPSNNPNASSYSTAASANKKKVGWVDLRRTPGKASISDGYENVTRDLQEDELAYEDESASLINILEPAISVITQQSEANLSSSAFLNPTSQTIQEIEQKMQSAKLDDNNTGAGTGPEELAQTQVPMETNQQQGSPNGNQHQAEPGNPGINIPNPSNGLISGGGGTLTTFDNLYNESSHQLGNATQILSDNSSETLQTLNQIFHNKIIVRNQNTQVQAQQQATGLLNSSNISGQGQDNLEELEKTSINPATNPGIVDGNNDSSNNVNNGTIIANNYPTSESNAAFYTPRQMLSNPPSNNLTAVSSIIQMHNNNENSGGVNGIGVGVGGDYNEAPLNGQYCLFPSDYEYFNGSRPENVIQNNDQSEIPRQNQAVPNYSDDDDEIFEDKKPEPYFAHRDELPVPDPLYVAAHTSEEFHPLIATSYKKDCRTWLWKSASQRSARLEQQQRGQGQRQ